MEMKSHSMGDECMAIAFHPSGLHLIVALQDKVQICNLLSNEIKVVYPLLFKGCTEIVFSHGGHLFACAAGQGNKEIHVYNFYTNDLPRSMQYTGHIGKVKSIAWFENDMGFASAE